MSNNFLNTRDESTFEAFGQRPGPSAREGQGVHEAKGMGSGLEMFGQNVAKIEPIFRSRRREAEHPGENCHKHIDLNNRFLRNRVPKSFF